MPAPIGAGSVEYKYIYKQTDYDRSYVVEVKNNSRRELFLTSFLARSA
jgi:hypothetical protein